MTANVAVAHFTCFILGSLPYQSVFRVYFDLGIFQLIFPFVDIGKGVVLQVYGVRK